MAMQDDDEEPFKFETSIHDAIYNGRSPVNVSALLDALEALHFECNISAHKRLPTTEAFLKKYDSVVAAVKESRPNKDEFEILRVIGRGGFGEVQLAKRKGTDDVFAIKRLSKCEMIKNKETAFFWEEREIMAMTDSEWIVKMHLAFQDDQYLYMVMDYMAGGDLESLAENFDISAESWTQFYAAELLLAIDAIHSMGYAHRDIKPGNVLLDAKGHVKLADFGTCCKLNKKGKIRSTVAVGTPDYISPEVLESQGGGTYTKTCDYWGFGVTIYEMVCGDLPFYCDTLAGTYNKIQKHQPEQLTFLDAEENPVDISDNCKDIIKKLLCHKTDRLSDVDQIKSHAWFSETDWATLHLKTPPVVPELSSVEDATNFSEVEEPEEPVELFKEARKFEGNHLPFIGFSYHSTEEGTEKRDAVPELPVTVKGLEKQVLVLQEENKNLRTEVAELNAKHAEESAVKEIETVAGEADISTISQTSALEIQIVEEKDKMKKALLDAKTVDAQHELASKRYEQQIKEIQDKLEIALSDKEHGCNKIKKLEERLQESTKEAEQFHVELDVANAKLRDEQAENSKMKEKTTEYETLLSETAASEAEHKKKADRAKQAKDRADMEVDELREKIRRLERTISRDEEARIELEEYNSTIVKQTSELKMKVSAIELSNRDLEDEVAVLQSQLDGAKKSRKESSVEGDTDGDDVSDNGLESVIADAKQLRHSIVELETSRNSLVQEHESQLETERLAKRELTSKLARANEKIESLEQDLKVAKRRVAEEVENNVVLANELAENEMEQQDVQASLAKKSSKLSELEAEVEVIKTQLKSTTEANSKQVLQIAKLEEELAKESSGKSASQMVQAKNLIDQAQATITENVQQLLEYEKQINLLKADNEKLTAELSIIKDERNKLQTKTGSSVALLKRLSSSQALDLANKKTDYESQIADLQQKLAVMETEHKALKEQHEADLKHQQKLSTDAIRRQPTVRAKKRDTGIGKDLDPESRKYVNKNKQLELQIQQLQKKVDEAIDAHKRDIEATSEEFRIKDEEQQEEYRIKEEAYLEQIKHLKNSLDRKSNDHQKMARSVNRITQLYDCELRRDPLNISSPPMIMIQKTLKEACYIDGVLMRPKKNMKKGWENFFCTADNELLALRRTSDVAGKPVDSVKIKDMHHVQPVTKDQVIHAKLSDVERIFKVVCVIVSTDSAKEEYPQGTTATKLEQDVYHFMGHVFEKSVSKKPELCSICCKPTQTKSAFSSQANRAYQCKYCKKITHFRHIRDNSLEIRNCPGMIESREMLFMAESKDDRDRWVSHLTNLIVQRGTATAMQFTTPTKQKSIVGEEENIDPDVSSPAALRQAVNEARRLSEDQVSDV